MQVYSRLPLKWLKFATHTADYRIIAVLRGRTITRKPPIFSASTFTSNPKSKRSKMTNFYKNILFVIVLISISNFSFSQSNEIKIKFIGNCGLYMTDGNLNIYIDFPYKSGAHKYMKYDESELDSIKDNSLFIFTHRHSDHYSKKLIKNLTGKKYGNWNVSKLEKLNNSNQYFSVQAFKTSHKFTLKHYSYCNYSAPL